MQTYIIEITDTFAGEANYSWARRARFEAPENASQSLLVRRGKKALDISARHTVEKWGDTIVLRWPTDNIIGFIDCADPDDPVD